MNKKLMTLAVAGAFAAPAAAFAQASNVQIFGTMYLEYAYAKQGAIAGPSGGDLVNVDIMQTRARKSASRVKKHSVAAHPPGSSARAPRTFAAHRKTASARATAQSA